MEQLKPIVNQLINGGLSLGKSILAAIVIFIVGRYLIKLINKLVSKFFEKRSFDPAVKTFLKSLVNITLMVLLIISIISTLGINTTSFAALLASAGVAVGMALSGNLQNLAGGLIILLFKPYKIGDFIETGGTTGTVKEIQIFSTILNTPDNKIIFIPNGALSNGTIINYSHQDTRRVDWSFGVDYGTNYDEVKNVISKVLQEDSRILQTPEPSIFLGELADSSVNITVRVWTKSSDYWNVYFDINKKIYETFNREGINFPFPQLTVHQS